MLLFKCKCGCHFTFNRKLESVTVSLVCQSCKNTLHIDVQQDLVLNYNKISEGGFSVMSIPDTATFEIKFNA